MQAVDLTDLEKLDKRLENLLKEFPEKRKDLHDNLADLIKNKVDSEISKSVNDSYMKIRKWQGKYVGSKGGYAAVRAVDTSVGKNSPGAITNYLEGGHKIRKPEGKNKYYKSRVKKIYVDGFHFYENSSKQIESEAISMIENFIDDIIDNF